MQDHPSTENTDTQTEPFDLEREDWDLAFEPTRKEFLCSAQTWI